MTHNDSYPQIPPLFAAQSRSPRAIAIGLVILLHLGLISAIGSGLRVLPPVAVPPTTFTQVVDKTPPASPPPTVWNKPVTIEHPPVTTPTTQPTVNTGAHAISTRPATTARPRPVVVSAHADRRYPLTQPAYPASARRAGAEGTVTLALHIQPDGRVTEAKIIRSSGFEALDRAAMREALHAWRFAPQTIDGVAVDAWHDIAVTFRLQR